MPHIKPQFELSSLFSIVLFFNLTFSLWRMHCNCCGAFFFNFYFSSSDNGTGTKKNRKIKLASKLKSVSISWWRSKKEQSKYDLNVSYSCLYNLVYYLYFKTRRDATFSHIFLNFQTSHFLHQSSILEILSNFQLWIFPL